MGPGLSALVLKGKARIEIRVSALASAWQEHNNEDCWLMVFCHTADVLRAMLISHTAKQSESLT